MSETPVKYGDYEPPIRIAFDMPYCMHERLQSLADIHTEGDVAGMILRLITRELDPVESARMEAKEA